ncbi:MAG: hypothetical protein ACXABK_04450 [Candidatus Heimdallarchaeaceae archaeon]|jgi:hypothetical protein
MKRIASVDFLRGFAIWLMLLLHEIQRVYDYSWSYSGDFADKPVLFIVLMLVLMFLGGWAGLFLLISSAGNTISMQKSYRKGRSISNVLNKQLTVGLILLFVAFLTESISGYHGALGDLVLGRDVTWLNVQRAMTMETIHTIAYAMIINGIIHAILSMREGYKKEKRNILIYLVLAAIAIVITIPIWSMSTGYGGITTVQEWGIIQQINTAPSGNSFREIVIKFFMLPIAGRPEPLLPYLATSFIGSIIGILMARDKPWKKELRIGSYFALSLIVSGLAGSAVMIANGKQDVFIMFEQAWNLPALQAWLPWFIFSLGVQIIAVLFFVKVIEFRGRGQEFANNRIVKYIRMHGFVALSIYNYQFLDTIPRWFLVLIGKDSAGGTVPICANCLQDNTLWGPWVLFVMVVNFLLWYLILFLWEKVNYIGGFEWIINVIAGFGVVSKRYKDYSPGMETKEEKRPWWKPIRLDVQEAFHNIEWINFVERDEIEHDKKSESIFSLKIGIVGFFLGLLAVFPVAVYGTIVAWTSRKKEGVNAINKAALIVGIIGLVISFGLIISLSVLTNGAIGLSL